MSTMSSSNLFDIYILSFIGSFLLLSVPSWVIMSILLPLWWIMFLVVYGIIQFKAIKRRLHDLNLSARWMLPYFLMLLWGIIFALIKHEEESTGFYLFEGIMMIPFLLLYLIPGSPNKNKYGTPYSKELNRTNFFYLDQKRIERKEFILGNTKVFVLPSVITIIRGYFSGELDTLMLMISYPGMINAGQLFSGISTILTILGFLVWWCSFLFTFFLGTKLRMKRLQDWGLNKNLVYISLGCLILTIIFTVLSYRSLACFSGALVILFELACIFIKGKTQANTYGIPYHDGISKKD